MINWSLFHFLRPWWLLIIPVAFLLWYLSSLPARKRSSWDRVIDPHLLPYLFRDGKKSAKKGSLFTLSFLLLSILALAGPTFKKIASETAFNKAPLVICLEVSPHMLATDVNPSRFKRALFKLEDLLKLYQGAEVALIAFAGDAHLVTPLSNDYNTVLTMARILVPEMMPIKGVNVADALRLAEEITKKTPRAQIVMMTSTNFDEFSTLHLSLPLIVWAFATVAGGPMQQSDGRFEQRGGQIPISKLRQDNLSKLGGLPPVTTLMFTPNQEDVRTVLSRVSEHTPVKSMRDDMFDEWHDLGPYLLACAMLMFFLGNIFGQKTAMLLCLFVLMPTREVKAGIADWFLRRDQQAEKALENNQPEQAAKLFSDDFNKGSAYYRAKKYDDAIKHLSSVNTSDGQFNLGNAYAQKQQYKEAIDAYDRALKLNPQNDDAKANKELLQKSQQQQEKQEKEKPEQDEKSDKDQQSDSSEQKSDQNKDGQEQGKEPKEKNGEQKEQAPSDPKKENQQQGKPNKEAQSGEQKHEQANNKGEQPKEQELDQKLDPETRHHFRRLEQKNSHFLKRKFLYESQKRQVDK